jgi:hypothetical protein
MHAAVVVRTIGLAAIESGNRGDRSKLLWLHTLVAAERLALSA